MNKTWIFNPKIFPGASFICFHPLSRHCQLNIPDTPKSKIIYPIMLLLYNSVTYVRKLRLMFVLLCFFTAHVDVRQAHSVPLPLLPVSMYFLFSFLHLIIIFILEFIVPGTVLSALHVSSHWWTHVYNASHACLLVTHQNLITTMVPL